MSGNNQIQIIYGCLEEDLSYGFIEFSCLDEHGLGQLPLGRSFRL
jgi:hypothetical protein